MKNIKISEEKFNFLKNLQKEMLTQNTAGQASPRFWVIKDYRKFLGVDDNYDADGFIITDSSNDCEPWDDRGDVPLEEWFKKEIENQNVDYELVMEEYENLDPNDVETIVCILNDYGSYSVVRYCIEDFIVPNTMFLTLKEAKEHLKSNAHNYTDEAHAYAMTALRSPEVSELYEILETLEFNDEEDI